MHRTDGQKLILKNSCMHTFLIVIIYCMLHASRRLTISCISVVIRNCLHSIFLSCNKSKQTSFACHILESSLLFLCSSVSTASKFSRFGMGSRSQLIHLDEVLCTGLENRLIDCLHSTTGTDCSHREDAGVICEGW